MFGIATAIVLLFCPPAVSAKTLNDQFYPRQEKVWNQIGAPRAWDYSIGSEQVVVAVIDTGMDITNPDLQPNVWINTKEIPNNGIDDDNNGYVDDINGWNFVGEKNNNVIPPADENLLSLQATFHGTIISGLIGAVGNNRIYGAGLNWKVKIMSLRVMNGNGSGSYNNIIDAVNYAIHNKADVISISIVGEATEERLKKVLRRAYDQGIVIVAAAGNSPQKVKGAIETTPLYPVCFDQNDSENWVIGVTSVDAKDALSHFASCGQCVDLAAPGENIYSTELYAPTAGLTSQFGGPWSGTSFSVPLVAGSAALLKSVRPEWRARDIIPALLNAADNIDDNNDDFVGQLGYGRLNVGRAVELAYNSRPEDANVIKIYYFVGNKIFVYWPQEQKIIYLAKLERPIVDMAYGDLNNDGKQEIAVLMSDKSGYQISILSSKGIQFNTFAIKSIQPSVKSASSLKIYAGNGINSAVIFSDYNVKTSKTDFVKLDWQSGKIITKMSLNGKIVDWTIKKTDSHLVAVQQKQDNLLLMEYDWNGQKTFNWQLSKVKELTALATDRVLLGDTEQAVILINRGQNSEQYVVDLFNRSFTRESVGSKSKYKQSFVLKDINSDGVSEILRFHSNGGIFSITDGRNRRINDLAVSKISGQLAD